jgi:hypothetical protein
MCTDIISQAAVINELIEFPPVQLTMPFFNCHNTMSTALQTSIGVAQGYASLASTMCMTVVTILIMQFFNRVKAKSPEEKLSSAKAQAQKRQRDLEQSIFAVAQNQKAMAPLILEIVSASNDNRVEESYATFQYNQRKPKIAQKAIREPPVEYVKTQKHNIRKFRSADLGDASSDDDEYEEIEVEVDDEELTQLDFIDEHLAEYRKITQKSSNESEQENCLTAIGGAIQPFTWTGHTSPGKITEAGSGTEARMRNK